MSSIQHGKIDELLEAIRHEFSQVTQEVATHRLQNQKTHDFEINQQLVELQQIRATVYDLEVAHRKLQDSYKDELEQLRVVAEQKDRVISDLTMELQMREKQTLLIPPVIPKEIAPTDTTVSAPTIKVAPSQNSITNGTLPEPIVEKQQPLNENKVDSNNDENTKKQIIPLVERASNSKPFPPFLTDLDPTKILPEFKKQTDDYYLLHNPELPKTLDIELHKSLDHSSVVCCIRFSNDGKYLATGCNRTTQVYEVATGNLTARLTDDSTTKTDDPQEDNHETDGGSTDLYIRSVCFSPDGKFLATGAEDKLIRIWDIERQEIVTVLRGHEQDIYSLDYFPHGDKLLSGSGDRTVRIWDLTTGECSLTLSIEDGVTTVAVSPDDGKYIAAGSLDHSVRVWDSQTGFLLERLDSENEHGNGHKDSVYSIMFTKNGTGIVSGSLDKTVKLWDLTDSNQTGAKRNGTCMATYVGHKDFVLSVGTMDSDKYILSGSKDRGVIFWDMQTTDPLLMLQGHNNSVISVSIANESVFPDKCKIFATGSGDCKARIWKLIEKN
ncbi:similar to Saccharomyces cerevisiae YCR084C TUP1 General repressor of transcription [Maudiozyma barnettii]|mgnify:CR=1 FL=1|uniref:Similar to Saccharomyces cerevisiae YCR084C TUP1 General repressor of transcription n=1 Tax=Maudiozyma barnettii TaxID=61262 RepID=A0A8H2VG25_9SACH|nr:chromatin-silencing transcriptional regulator TUP1 [Kazachstania barnettii]CAB4254781.1 similar to Saccharomyces cerevisiae YCR084C TUP1 General repressor of transcription [Kazachstania barnettii]CAD1782925.1 similar to Saccharomyces cerevisiae YCR084C TUP1 General repressor of transcription [Kazachstania barnettii]